MLMAGHRFLRLFFDDLLHDEVHKQVKRFRFDDEGPGRPVRVVIEMLVDTGILNNDQISGLPVVSDAVMDLVALSVQDVKDGLIHMAVLVRLSARGEHHVMGIKDLA